MTTLQRNIPLDSYRGILAILVAIGHYFYWLGDGDKFPISFILAVDFFFILSGYVLTLPILLDQESSLKLFLFQFIKNRFFRLFPLYLLLVIPLSFYATTINQDLLNGFDWIKLIGLLNILPIGEEHNFNILTLDVSWSISAEFWVGILYFPILFIFRRKGIFFVFLAFLSIFFILLIKNYSPNFMDVHFHRINEFITFGIIRTLLGLSIGSVIAYITVTRQDKTRQDKTRQDKTRQDYILHSIIQISIVIIILSLFNKNYDRNLDFIAPILFGIFIFSIGKRAGILYSSFNNPVGHYLGKISYSIYLSHSIFVVLIIQKILVKQIIIYLTSVIIASSILYFLVEKPFITYGKKIKFHNT